MINYLDPDQLHRIKTITTIKENHTVDIGEFEKCDGDLEPVRLDVLAQLAQFVAAHEREQVGRRMYLQDVAPGRARRLRRLGLNGTVRAVRSDIDNAFL